LIKLSQEKIFVDVGRAAIAPIRPLSASYSLKPPELDRREIINEPVLLFERARLGSLAEGSFLAAFADSAWQSKKKIRQER
jgi:hypothetical protein